MRVIAGSARHILLKTVYGQDTRPTTDRIKETLFNMLQFGLPDATILDLFSGSGAIGIEALSRGASKAVFVENQKAAVACIEYNLKATRLCDQAEVCHCDVLSALGKLDGQDAFSYIFIDPPYQKQYEQRVLDALVHSTLVDEDTIIIIEALKDTNFSFVEKIGLEIYKEKKYKSNKHVFFRLDRSMEDDEGNLSREF